MGLRTLRAGNVPPGCSTVPLRNLTCFEPFAYLFCPPIPTQAGLFVTSLTQHVDLFPTLAAMAEVPKSDLPAVLDGESLLPFMAAGDELCLTWVDFLQCLLGNSV